MDAQRIGPFEATYSCWPWSGFIAAHLSEVLTTAFLGCETPTGIPFQHTFDLLHTLPVMFLDAFSLICFERLAGPEFLGLLQPVDTSAPPIIFGT